MYIFSTTPSEDDKILSQKEGWMSSDERTLHLHIGRHKTGTTTFQNFLNDNQQRLHERGFHTFQSQITLDVTRSPIQSWAHEIPLVIMRPEFDFVLRMLTKPLNLSAKEMTRTIVENLNTSAQNVIASHEAMSYVRDREELEMLRSFASDAKRKVKIHLVLRQHESWLRSYKNHFGSGTQRITDKESYLYLEEDSWLFKNQVLVGLYEEVFGEGSVSVINYEESLNLFGDICPALIRSIGLCESDLVTNKTKWLNVSTYPNEI